MTRKLKFEVSISKAVFLMASVILVLLLLGYSQSSAAQQPTAETFASPADACVALYRAAQNGDDQSLQAILGAGQELTSSSDDIENKLEHDGFVQKYQQMHRLVREPDNTTVLYVGAENWPFPIPLVAKNGRWHFDSDAGSNEVLFRRIGQNEAMTIGSFRLLVLAQREHLARSRDFGSVPEYATRFEGVKGAHNGLDWKAAAAIPPALVNAGISDQPSAASSAVPYYGYYFRILNAQGKYAPGGAKNYFSNGKMTSGFAFVAYPAEYRSSGVKTFIAGPDGVVHEKDLGADTSRIATSMTLYDPDPSWHLAEQQVDGN
jgi:hypothetical protein